MADSPSDQTLDGFRALKRLGSTGLWESYSGYSEELAQEVRVTVVHAEALKEEALRRRFAEVARAATKLDHPMLQRCLMAVPLADGRWSVLSEPPQGITLAAHLKSHGRLTGDEAVQLVALLCDAVDAAHQRGVLHGDIRPEHIFLPGGLHALKPKLAGFAIGVLPQGPNGFAAPELAQRKEPTPLTDIYSLGAVLWACLTGAAPTDYDVDKLPRLPESEEHLEPVLKRALNRDFSKRYFTASELARALTKANGTLVPPEQKSRATDMALPQVEAPPAPGEVQTSRAMLGPYEIVKLLGEGSMGQVFLGRHKALGRQVAIKVLRPEQYRRGDLIQRFFQEARTVNQINHEHIVEIFDFVQETGPNGPTAVYCVMELLQGESLADAIERGGMKLKRAFNIVRQLCDALAAAHKVGVVHRDVKPDNIFLIERAWQRDYVKVLDFGVAKLTHSDPDAPLISTMDGAIIGTPMCMAPEQAAGTAVDWRADIYATGVILYLLLSGRLPFDAANFAALAVQLITRPPPPLPARTPGGEDIDPALKALVLKCLEKEPQNRPQSMKELGDALLPFMADKPAASASAPVQREAPPKRSRGAVWATLAALIIAGGGGALAYLRPWEPPPAVVPLEPPKPAIAVVEPKPSEPSPDVKPPEPTPPVEPSPDGAAPDHVDTKPVAVKPAKPVALTFPMIQDGVAHGRKDVGKCFERFGTQLKEREGHVDVQMTIELPGTVSAAQVLTPGLEGSPLEGCLVKEVKRLKFPRNIGPPQKIKVPFNFRLAPG